MKLIHCWFIYNSSCTHSAATAPSTKIRLIRSVTIMIPPASPADSTIETNPDDLTVFPFLILLIDLITMSLSIKYCMQLAVSVSDKLLLSYIKSIFKSFSGSLFQANFLLSTLTANTLSLPFLMHCSPEIPWLLLNFLLGILSTSQFWSSVPLKTPNFFLSASHSTWQTAFLVFFLKSSYFSLLAFPCFHSFQILTPSFHQYDSQVKLYLISIHKSYMCVDCRTCGNLLSKLSSTCLLSIILTTLFEFLGILAPTITSHSFVSFS